MRSVFLLLVAAAFACEAPRIAPSAPPSAERAEQGARPSPPAVEAPPPASAPSAPAELPTPDLMMKLATGALPLASLVDADRGLAYAMVREDASGRDPRADRTGLIHEAGLACGTALAQRTAHLGRDLAMRIEGMEGPVFRCEGWTCRHDALMEYDVTGRYDFERVGGQLRLVSATFVEGGPVTEEFTRKGESWAEAQRARLLVRRCP